MKNPLFVYCVPALFAGSFSLSSVRADEPFVEQVEVLEIQFEPVGQLLNPGDGFFYGAAGWVDTARAGVIYRFAPGEDAEVLYTFATVADASYPNVGGSGPCSPLIVGPDGAFYGATQHGGAHKLGTIYRFSQDGVFSVIHDITGTEGWGVNSLISTPAGDLFGLMSDGGAQSGGTLFRLSLDGVFQTVYNFTEPAPAMQTDPSTVFPPWSPVHLAVGADGEIYGATSIGGPVHVSNYSNGPVGGLPPIVQMAISYGCFFRYDGPNAITELSNFDPIEQRCGPLVPVADGFYTVADSVLAHIALDGTIAVKTDFRQMQQGRLTLPAPILVDGKIFGVSYHGGTADSGFIYRYVTGGETEIIYHFTEEFARRRKWLVEGNDGLIYGLAALPKAGITAEEQLAIVNGGAKAKAAGKKKARRNPDALPVAFRYRETPGAVNFVPAARPDVAWLPAKAKKGASTREVLVDVLANDADADKNPLVIQSVEAADGSGSATIVDTAKGPRIRFSTSEADPASTLFTYRVTDGKGGEATGQLSVKAPLTGTFTGTVGGEGLSSAPVTVTVGKKNVVTATAVVGGKKFTGKGTLDVDDNADLSLKAKGHYALSLHLGIERGSSRKVEAKLVDRNTVYQGSFGPKTKKK
ncbi:choice-of-anchor tandem repeat GloVer-containing protein [Luteolibacter sp. Populi]|uniref:choice-of-anchor tandem repeat GloVer-containing protein n=1 Tax=Luteolibacter sp. Populi TaxID=3230487 RepID=UPI0034650455